MPSHTNNPFNDDLMSVPENLPRVRTSIDRGVNIYYPISFISFLLVMPVFIFIAKGVLHYFQKKKEEERKKSLIRKQSQSHKFSRSQKHSSDDRQKKVDGIILQRGKWFDKPQEDVSPEQLDKLMELLNEYEASLQIDQTTSDEQHDSESQQHTIAVNAADTANKESTTRNIRIIKPIPTIHPKHLAQEADASELTSRPAEKIISWDGRFPAYNLTTNQPIDATRPVYRLRGDGNSYVYINPILLAFLHKYYADAEITLKKLCENGKSHIGKRQSGFMIREASNAKKLDKHIHQKKKVKQKNHNTGKEEVLEASTEKQVAYIKGKECTQAFRFYGESVAHQNKATLFQINRFKAEHKKNGDVYYFPTLA